MNGLFLSLLVITLISCRQVDPGANSISMPAGPSVQDSLTDELTQLHQLGFINGFGVAIVDDQGVLYAEGIGFADVASQQPYTRTTIQNIGSVSKTFIGVALLKAAELGHLKLDDPVNSHLPFRVSNPNFPDAAITVRQLATHTSSILDTDRYNESTYVLKESVPISDATRLALGEVFNVPESKMPLLDYLEKVLSEKGEWYEAAAFTTHRPGAIYEYSNVGAALAAAVLERATGRTYNEFVTEHLLNPLGMTRSGLSFEEVDSALHSTLYVTPTTELPYYSLITYPDGGMITCSADLGNYLSELVKGYLGNGVLLQKESYRELFTEQLRPQHLPGRSSENAYDDEYNSGIFMGFTPRGFIGHTGGDPGIATFMFFDPITRTGRLLMINTRVGGSQGGVDEFYAIWNKLEAYAARLVSTERS